MCNTIPMKASVTMTTSNKTDCGKHPAGPPVQNPSVPAALPPPLPRSHTLPTSGCSGADNSGTQWPRGQRTASASFVPSLVVVQVSEQHVLGDGLGQGGHGLVVLRDDLQKPRGEGEEAAARLR